MGSTNRYLLKAINLLVVLTMSMPAAAALAKPSNTSGKVRVVVVGNYYNEANGTKGEPVGTYIDVILKPK